MTEAKILHPFRKKRFKGGAPLVSVLLLYGTPYLPIHLTAASPPCKQTNKIVYTVSANKNLFADTLDIYCNFHREVRLGGWGLRGRIRHVSACATILRLHGLLYLRASH